MRLQSTFLTALAVVAFATSGCDSDDASSARECSLDAGPESVSIDAAVTYAVTLMGEGEVDSITYQFGEESHTVPNPTLPWVAIREVDGGDEVSITARGRVTDGRISVQLQAVGNQGGTGISLSLTDECAQTL